MWYKLTSSGYSTLSVGKCLITKDSRFSVAYYSVSHGFSCAAWDLHITNVRLSDAAHYQCHVVTKYYPKSIRSNARLFVKGTRIKRIRFIYYIWTQRLCEKEGEQICNLCKGDHRDQVKIKE